LFFVRAYAWLSPLARACAVVLFRARFRNSQGLAEWQVELKGQDQLKHAAMLADSGHAHKLWDTFS
jgi:hypothetical protein